MDEYGRTLTHAVLTGVVQEFLPPASMLGNKIFATGPNEMIMGSQALIDIVRYPRTVPRYRPIGAKSGKNALLVEKTISAGLPLLKESQDIPASVLNYLRLPGDAQKMYGKAKITAEAKKLDILIENAREKARWDILTTGILTQALAKAGDSAFTVTFGIAATHVPIMGTTAGYGCLWSTVATSTVASDISLMKSVYAQDSGKDAKYGICNTTTMNYILNSTLLRNIMGEQYKSDALRLGAIKEICGLEILVYDQGYTVSGTFTPFLPNGRLVIWSGEPMPEYVGLADDVAATTPGKFSKAFESDDPSGVTLLEEILALPSGERVSELFCATVA